jgi:hypothetical protein
MLLIASMFRLEFATKSGEEIDHILGQRGQSVAQVQRHQRPGLFCNSVGRSRLLDFIQFFFSFFPFFLVIFCSNSFGYTQSPIP